MTNPLGANYKTTLTAAGSAIFSLLTILAALPYDLGDVGTIIPPTWKAKVAIASAIAAFVLKVWNGAVQKSADVTGGTIVQDKKGDVDEVATVKKEIMEGKP